MVTESSYDPTPSDWESPDWEMMGQVHEWKRYVSGEVQQAWDTFTDDQKKMLARQADNEADKEEWD